MVLGRYSFQPAQQGNVHRVRRVLFAKTQLQEILSGGTQRLPLGCNFRNLLAIRLTTLWLLVAVVVVMILPVGEVLVDYWLVQFLFLLVLLMQ